MSIFKGSGVAIVTPFYDDGQVDFSTFARLIEFQIQAGTDAIVVTGTTGEASTMSDEEQLEVIAFCVKQVAGRIPVIAGVGSNDTRHGIALSYQASLLGVDALLEVTPYYNKTNQEGLYRHFKVIADAVNCPIILYNVPGRTQVNLLPETVYRLSLIDNIVALKDATGDLSQTIETRRLVGEDFAIYAGNDDVIVPVLAAGGIGVISVLANVAPEKTHRCVSAFLEGNIAESLALQLQCKPLIDALFMEPNPIPVKRALSLMNYPSMSLRLPLYESGEHTCNILKEQLRAVGCL